MYKKLIVCIFSLCSLFSLFVFSFGISSASCAVFEDSWMNAYVTEPSCQVAAPIQTINSVIRNDYFYNDFLSEQSRNSTVIFVPISGQKAEYNADFTGLINNLWFNNQRNTTPKLMLSLQGLQKDMEARYNDSSLSPHERTKFAYLSYLSRAVIEALGGTPVSGGNKDTPSVGTGGLTQIQTYTALNGRSYTIRQSDQFFLFSRGDSSTVLLERRARSFDNLINYIEFQNRLIAIAPNGRYYGIRKHNGYFKINRDNGSVLDTNFNSFDEAKRMLDTCAVDGSVPEEYTNMCGFNTYGRN